jgi:hypothetical protein
MNLTCALCDTRFINNKSCEMLNKTGASNFGVPGLNLKVRSFNNVEFASMNRIKLIAC